MSHTFLTGQAIIRFEYQYGIIAVFGFSESDFDNTRRSGKEMSVEPVGSSGRIAKNVMSLFIGDVATRVLTAIASIVVARHLGPGQYGVLSMCLAWAAVATYFTDMGLTHTFIREGTKPGAHLPSLLGGALKLRAAFMLMTGALSVMLIKLLYPTPDSRAALYMVVLPTLVGGALQGLGAAYFQVTQEMQYTAFIRAVSGFVTSMILLGGVFLRAPLPLLMLAYGLSSLIGGIISVVLMLRKSPGIRGWHSGLLDGLGAFTVGGLFLLALPQMGPLILERVTDLSQVGVFGAAMRFPSMLYQIPGMVAVAFYPQLFALGARNSEEHFRLSAQELKVMSLLGVGLALPFGLYANWVMQFLLGAKWIGTGVSSTLAALAWIVAIQSVNFALGDSLTTQGLQARRSSVLAGAFVAGATAYYYFGHRWGGFGGAMGAFVVEAVLWVGFSLVNPQGWHLLRNGLGCVLPKLSAATLVVAAIRFLVPLPMVGFILTPITFGIVILMTDSETRSIVRNLSRQLRGRVFGGQAR